MKSGEQREAESIRFLERDFNQSFEQLRHYDKQIFSILEFSFTAYSALVGLALGFYELGFKEHLDYSYALAGSLSVGFLVGIFLFVLIIRNRAYFVKIARYR